MNYGYYITKHDIHEIGTIRFAQWNHPGAKAHPREFHANEIIRLRRFIRPGSKVIDVGAHIGDTAVTYAAITGVDGMVYAFEPNPSAFEVLLENSLLNKHVAPIIPFPFAITKETGHAVFHYTDHYCNGGCMVNLKTGIGTFNNTEPLVVMGVNPQELFKTWDNISFIKTDTEGNDGDVLDALHDIILINKPVIQVEFYIGSQPEEKRKLYQDIVRMGYKIYDSKTDNRVSEDFASNRTDFWDAIGIP